MVMAYDQNSFLQGISVGKSLKGFSVAITSAADSYEPFAWNDEGVYTYFYLNFKGMLSPFSSGQFFESLVLMANNKKLEYSTVKQINATTVQIFTDISQYTYGVRVYGSPNSLLNFTNGQMVPKFAIQFYVKGLDIYVDVAYIYEKWTFPEVWQDVTEQVTLSFQPYQTQENMIEQITFPTIFQYVQDTVAISYYQV